MSDLLVAAVAGNAAGAGGATYVEDVFSTYLYEGNGTYSPKTGTNTIENGVDLDSKGGLVWVKGRSATTSHFLYDTERGTSNFLSSNATNAENTTYSGYGVTSYNSNGFTLEGNVLGENANGADLCSWTFAKQEKFFDVVTWTGVGPGTSSNEVTIPHNLGAKPGAVIVKRTDSTSDWWLYTDIIDGTNDYLVLNSTAAAGNSGNDVATSTHFSVGGIWNVSGATYVAYLFAHNDGDGGFGENGDQDIIKCGSFEEDGSATEVDLGFEPQWVLIKNADATGNWWIADTMRGFSNNYGVSGEDAFLFPNLSTAETDSYGFTLTSKGFIPHPDLANGTHIYIAIRRGPMKTPESGTEVFAPYISDATTPFRVESGFPVDSWLYGQRTSTNKWFWFDRLRGSLYLKTNTTSADTAYTAYFDDMEQASITGSGYSGYINYAFRRAPGFFDVVAYNGTGTEPRTVYHNLGVAPEMIWTKRRDSSSLGWVVWHKDLTTNTWLRLDSTQAETSSPAAWGGTFSADNYTIANDPYDAINGSGGNLIAYLFATVPGVSKVGSFSHTNGSTTDVDCGFSAGARFVMLKRYNTTGNWIIMDTERGIVAGNDPYLSLNTTDAEVTTADVIDPLSSGFQVASGFLATGDWIFLAIA